MHLECRRVIWFVPGALLEETMGKDVVLAGFGGHGEGGIGLCLTRPQIGTTEVN